MVLAFLIGFLLGGIVMNFAINITKDSAMEPANTAHIEPVEPKKTYLDIPLSYELQD